MRESGILMPVASLPGPFGIGTLGKPAYDFIDFLKKAHQAVWQILPVSPTGFGDSPYQSSGKNALRRFAQGFCKIFEMVSG